MGDARRVRVLAVDQALGVWGAQLALLRLALALPPYGIDVVLAAPWDTEFSRRWRAEGLAAVDVNVPQTRSVRTASGHLGPGLALRELRATARLVADLRRMVWEVEADVLHGNSLWTHAETAVAGRLAGVPTVLHLHEETPLRVGRAARGMAVGLASRAVAVSAAVADGVPAAVRGRVGVVRNGVPVPQGPPEASQATRRRVRADLGLASSDVAVAWVGRLDPCKRLEDALTAVASAGGRSVLLVAGEPSDGGGYLASHEARIASLGGRVRRLGLVGNVPELLAASDVLLHTGVVEGLPLVVLEAMSAGLPVIAYDVAGVGEVVVDGHTGVLCPPKDTVALAAALERLAGDRELRLRFGRAGAERVIEEFTIHHQAGRFAAILRRAAHLEVGTVGAPDRVEPRAPGSGVW